MGKKSLGTLYFVLACFLLMNPHGARAAGGLTEETIMLPAVFEGTFGDYTANLEAVIVRPDDDRHHPLAILNHGRPLRDYRDVVARQYRRNAIEFAKRGWVAVAFTRRGYGHSEGETADGSGSCGTAVYEPVGRAAATEIREVIRLMKEKPYVDGSKIISVGRSAGGFATVALTADPPAGLVAAISFAGGHGGSGTNGMVCNEHEIINAFTAYGKTSRIPMLWVYAENDHWFAPVEAKEFHKAFTGAGGQAELIIAPAFGNEGHTLFSTGGIPVWTKYVDAFLKEQNLQLLDAPIPFEDTVKYPEGLSERGKFIFLQFLDAEGHKAFATSNDGHWGWRSGQQDVDAAAEGALNVCKGDSGRDCHLAVVDDQVVGQ